MIDYDFNRNEWLYSTSPPITGPSWNPKDIRFFNIHYTGDSNSYAGKSEQAILNSIQKDYQNNRGYSFGYSSAVGLSGSTYEGRGDTYRAASNGMENNYGMDSPTIGDNLEIFSCLLIAGVPDIPSAQLVNGVRKLYQSVIDRIGRELIINGHRDMAQTACPGDKIYSLIQNKTFYPVERSKDDMETLRIPRRIIDTRESNSPVTGARSFDIKPRSASVVDAEITVTAIPLTAEAGYAGLGPTDSFSNWTQDDINKPIPHTFSAPVSNGVVSLYFSTKCHVIITVRAEG